jgi:hypothetical protein
MDENVADDRQDSLVVEVLREIADRNDGQITAEEVVDVARRLPKDHPLYQAFEWSDKRAGHAYRVHQARLILNRHRTQIMVTSSSRVYAIKAPLFVHHPEKGKESGYVSISRLKLPDSQDLARAAVVAAYSRAAAALANARALAQALGCEKMIEEDVERLHVSRRSISEENRPQA